MIRQLHGGGLNKVDRMPMVRGPVGPELDGGCTCELVAAVSEKDGEADSLCVVDGGNRPERGDEPHQQVYKVAHKIAMGQKKRSVHSQLFSQERLPPVLLSLPVTTRNEHSTTTYKRFNYPI